MSSNSRLSSASVRSCPVCRTTVSPLIECCSTRCSETLDDARASIGWEQLQYNQLSAEFGELEEKVGLIQLKLEKQEQLLARLEQRWLRSVGALALRRANSIRILALRAQKKIRRLAKLFKPLDKRWKVFKSEVADSKRKLDELKAILGQGW